MSVSKTWLALTLALFSLPLFVGLGRMDLGGDEAAYSFGVDRMLEIGDWLAPRSSPNEDAIFLEKPPLKFWIVAAPIRLGLLPHDEFGLRFWDAVFGGIAFLYVFAIGARLAGTWCGAVAVLILFVHYPLIFEHGLRGNNTEAPLFLCYCGGMFHFMAWARSDDRRRRVLHAMAVGLCFVLGFMCKDVAAVFLPIVLIAATLIYRDYRTQFLRDWHLWSAAALLALALIAPWFMYAQWRFGAALWDTMLMSHVYQRFTGYLDPAHVKPWHFYFTMMWTSFAGSQSLVLVIGGLGALFAQTIRRHWPEGGLILLWFALPVGLISLGTSKLYHYTYPFLPPLALAGGYLAGLVVMLAPVPFQRALRALDRRAAARMPRATARLSRPPMKTILLGVAAAAVALGIVSLVYGPIRINMHGVTVFRSASVLRPSLVAFVCATLAGAGRGATRAVVPLLVATALPLPAYRDVLSRLDLGSHPMRDARDCVMQVDARPDMAAVRARGIYVDGLDSVFNHEHYYYFRKLRPWEIADKSAPSDKLYPYLYDPAEWRPALIRESTYREFTHRTDLPVPPLPPGTSPPMVSFTDVILLLPGPFAVCSNEVTALAERR